MVLEEESIIMDENHEYKVAIMRGRSQRTGAVVLIAVVSFVAGMLITPSGDPTTGLINGTIVLLVAAPCYLVGLRQGQCSPPGKSCAPPTPPADSLSP